MTIQFFMNNLITLTSTQKYAPSDDRLLSIPLNVNLGDPFFKMIFRVPPSAQKNDFLIGVNLLNFFKSINQVLAIVYATHRYALESSKETFPTNISQN